GSNSDLLDRYNIAVQAFGGLLRVTRGPPPRSRPRRVGQHRDQISYRLVRIDKWVLASIAQPVSNPDVPAIVRRSRSRQVSYFDSPDISHLRFSDPHCSLP